MNIGNFIEKLVLKPGASESMIEAVQSRFRIRLTDDHRKFLLMSNGADGLVGKSYLLLWSLEELENLNKLYSVDQFAPGLLLIGSDGGGMAYAIDTRQSNLRFVEVPFIGMSIDDIKFCGFTFHDFLEHLFTKE